MNSYRHPERLQTLWPLVSAFTVLIPQGQLTREPRLAQMEMHLTLLLPLFCLSITAPLKLHISTQTGKMPFTGMLQLASTGSKVQQMMSPPSAANNLCRQMGFVRMVPRALPSLPWIQDQLISEAHLCCFFCFFSLFILWTPLVQQWLFNKGVYVHRSLNQSTLKLICCFMAESFDIGDERRAQHRHFSPSKWGKKVNLLIICRLD